MTAEVAPACPACDAPLLADDRFCEQCGAAVAPAPVEDAEVVGGCEGCGAPADMIDADGYCMRCGMRRRTAPEHREIDLAIAAGVTDQGLTHARNEDALHLELIAGGATVAVICDGISTAASADIAAQRAAQAAGRTLATAAREEPGPGTAAMVLAMAAAHEAVMGIAGESPDALDHPSCTLVAALCLDGELTVGWAGDSRAYWIARDQSRQLTVDDSWASEQVAAGLMREEQAMADPRAHAVTRWLGADAPRDPPHVVTFGPPASGRLVLCSDGLWNYAPRAGDLASLIDNLPPLAPPLAIARSLTDFALASGGRDNVTVAVIETQPRRTDRP